MSYLKKQINKILYEITPAELITLTQHLNGMDVPNVNSLCNMFGAKIGDIADLASKIGSVSDELRLDPNQLTNSSIYIKNAHSGFINYLESIVRNNKNISEYYKSFLNELNMEAKMTHGNVRVIGTATIDAYIKNNKLGSMYGIGEYFKTRFNQTITTHAADGTALVGDALAKAKTVAIKDAIFSGSRHALAVGGIIGGYFFIKSYFKSSETEIDPKDLASDMETGKNISPEVQAQLPSIPASSSEVKAVTVAINNQMKEEGLLKYWKPVEEFAYNNSNYIIPLLIIGAAGVIYKYKPKKNNT